MRVIFFILSTIIVSCTVSRTVVDNDDLYYSERRRDTVVTPRIRPYNDPRDIYYTPNYGWFGYDPFYSHFRIYPPRQVIIIERNNNIPNYGKRPSREGNINREPSTIRRGRN